MPDRQARLDVELVRRGFARSRKQAHDLIGAGKVAVRGMRATKPALGVAPESDITVDSDGSPEWASRGAHKLLGALAVFGAEGLTVTGRRCLDAGASTGGFTDVLLRAGAREVVAVDVGQGLLDPRIRNDDRVEVREQTNVRTLSAEQINGPVDVVVADLSFISLRLVLPALVACASPGADLLPMIKPQFEVGKGRLGSGGVVRDLELRAAAVAEVLRSVNSLGLMVSGVVASSLPGPAGNVEYFAWLRHTNQAEHDVVDIDQLAHTAVMEGPR